MPFRNEVTLHAFLDTILDKDSVPITAVNNGDGTYSLKVNIGNVPLSISNSDDFYLEIVKGNIPGTRTYRIPGRKDAISNTVLDDISQVPSTTVLPNPDGIQMEVVSSSASDTSPAGDGVRSVDIHYLDTDGNEQEETVIMNGTTPVDTVATNIDRIQWIHTKTVGGGAQGVAIGNISLRDTTGATTYEYIAAGGNQSLSCRYHIPTGKTGYITGWHASGITRIVDVRLRATVERFDGAAVLGVFLFQDAVVLNNTASGWIPFKSPVPILAGATVKASAISDAAGGDAGAMFEILLVDN